MGYNAEREWLERIRVAFIDRCEEIGVDSLSADKAEQWLEKEILQLQSSVITYRNGRTNL